MKKRPKPQKREFEKVRRHVADARGISSRRFELRPSYSKHYIVELRVSLNRRWMLNEIRRLTGPKAKLYETELMGLCWTWSKRRKHNARPRLWCGKIVAMVFVNRDDLRDDYANVLSHELTHAAMGVARFERANLGNIVGEEVLCYAQGYLMRQAVSRLWSMDLWGNRS